MIYEVWNFDDAEFIYQTLENTPVGALLGGWPVQCGGAVGEYGEREGFFLWFGSLKHCVATP